MLEFSAAGFDEYEKDQFLIFSEMDHNLNEKQTLKAVSDIVTEHQPDIVFWDNMTTSRCYMDKKVDIQSQVAKLIKNYADQWDIPIVVIAHTGANVTENHSGIINMNDIRGGKSVVNMIQFFYIMQTFFDGNDRTVTLRTAKHRGYVIDGPMYDLRFSRKAKIFIQSRGIKFEDFKNAYKNRNKL
jgi:hypothetical protein